MIRLWTLVGFFGLLSVWNFACRTQEEAPPVAVASPPPAPVVDEDAARPDAGLSLDQFGAHSEKLLQLLMDARVQQ